MKLAHDPRHIKRRETVKFLFANLFQEQKANDLALKVLSRKKQIDKLIASSAPEWPIAKINKIDLAILRLSVYELLEGDTPQKVAIDEAVELAKEFGGENSPNFINGVLGTVMKELGS